MMSSILSIVISGLFIASVTLGKFAQYYCGRVKYRNIDYVLNAFQKLDNLCVELSIPENHIRVTEKWMKCLKSSHFSFTFEGEAKKTYF